MLHLHQDVGFPPAQKYAVGAGVETCQSSAGVPSEVEQGHKWPLVRNTGTLIGCQVILW